MDTMSVLWLCLMVGFLIVEGVTVALVSVWFAGGALAALIASALNAPLWLQIAVFVAVSAALVAALRPLSRKVLKSQEKPTNVDSVPGTVGRVTEEIDNIAATGRVKLGSMDWKACSSENVLIPAGALVRADKVEGVKVYVTQVTAEK